MARSHLYRPIQDAAGNLRTNARVRVFDPGSNSLTNLTLFAADTGSTQVANVHTAANGIIDFYTDEPARFRIGIKVGDEPETLFENIDCLEPGYSLDDTLGAPSDHSHPHSHAEYAATGHTHPGQGTQANEVSLSSTTINKTLTDADSVVFSDGTDVVLTLPDVTDRAGRTYTIKNLNVSPLTLAGGGATIDGDTDRVLAQYDAITVICNGTNWSVV